MKLSIAWPAKSNVVVPKHLKPLLQSIQHESQIAKHMKYRQSTSQSRPKVAATCFRLAMAGCFRTRWHLGFLPLSKCRSRPAEWTSKWPQKAKREAFSPKVKSSALNKLAVLARICQNPSGFKKNKKIYFQSLPIGMPSSRQRRQCDRWLSWWWSSGWSLMVRSLNCFGIHRMKHKQLLARKNNYIPARPVSLSQRVFASKHPPIQWLESKLWGRTSNQQGDHIPLWPGGNVQCNVSSKLFIIPLGLGIVKLHSHLLSKHELPFQ